MRTYTTTARLLSSLVVLIVATACTGSVVRTDSTPITDSTESVIRTDSPLTEESSDLLVRTDSSLVEESTESVVRTDSESTTESVVEVTETPDIQAVIKEGSTVPPLLEEDPESSNVQDIQDSVQVTTLAATPDVPEGVKDNSDVVSSARSTLEVDNQEHGEASPAVVKSDEVNYSGWTVLKVGGFNESPEAAEPVEDTDGDEEAVGRQTETSADERSEVDDSDYPLLDLEERAGVRVLQENRLEGFYEVAVSPSDREAVTQELRARGFQVEDKNIDLGTMMDETTLHSLRKAPLQGEATFDSYMTYEEIEQFILAFEEQNPHTVSRQVIGKSVEGRDIHMLTLSMGGRQCRSVKDERPQRQSRQMKNPNSSNFIRQTLEAVTNIIRYGNAMDREVDINLDSSEYQEQETVQTDEEKEGKLIPLLTPNEISNLEPEAITATHMLLQKIMQNIPYEFYINGDEDGNNTAEDTIKHTYKALQEIINTDKDNSDDYVVLDSSNQPEAVQLTYKVLQRVMNHNSKKQKRNPHESIPFGEIRRRIAKSLNLDDVNSTEPNSSNTNKATPDATDIEADILFLLSTFIPKEYTKNATLIESIKKSLIIISKQLPKDGELTQEVINTLAPQIINLPGVVGVSSSIDGSDSRNDLIIKLANLIGAKDNKYSVNPTEDDEDIVGPVQRMASCKPVIFLDGGIHAREWISPAFMVYTLTELVKNTPLLLGAEWRVVPVLNPDGYVHTWTKDRLWRKNRAKSSGCPGVDLNRNFGYKFGGAGTSTRSCSEIYRGNNAFSEPESRALRSAVREVKDRMKAYVTVHSYGQMILHPWGYSKTVHPNNDLMTSMGTGMAGAIKKVYGTSYVVGSASRILYSAAGGSDDWVASEGVPYSFTLELRDKGRHGFVLPASQIKATVVETFSGLEYLGNRIINENTRSASPTLAAASPDQSDNDSLFNNIGHTAPILAPAAIQPIASLVPVTPGFGAGSAGFGSPLFYSAAVLPREPIVRDESQENRPIIRNNPFQVPPNFNIPQAMHYFNQAYQPAPSYQQFVGAPQVQATQEIRTPIAARPTFSDSIPNVSILGNQQANVQLAPFGSVGQSSPHNIAFAQNQVAGNAQLVPVYPNPFYSPQTSSPDQSNSFATQADNIRDKQVVDYLSQVLSSLMRNEAESSPAESNSASAPQNTFENYEGPNPVPYIVQNPYWNVPMPALTPVRQSAYSSDSAPNPSFNENTNVFIPYNSPMVVRTSTDFGENQQFPFPSPQFQNPEQSVQNFQPSTLEQFINLGQQANSFSAPGDFSTPPQFSQFRPILPSPAQPNFKTDINQLFHQNPNENIEEQRLRHHFNAEYHRNSPVLVSLGNSYNEQSPTYSTRFNLPESEVGERTPMISYHRSLGRQQNNHHRGFDFHHQYHQ